MSGNLLSMRNVLIAVSVLALVLGCGDNGTNGQNRAPNAPSNPTPANGAADLPLAGDVALSWQCSDPDDDPLTYDVYFGTQQKPPLVSSDQSQTSYQPDQLQPNSTYYWQIVAKDDHGHDTEGNVWSFSTEGGIGNWGTATYFLETYGVSFTADGQYMYYEDSGREVYSYRTGGTWSAPVEIQLNVDDAGDPWITGDGNTLYFTRGIAPYIWYSQKIGDVWQDAQPVSFDYIPDFHSNLSFSVSWDGNTIWFSRPQGVGDSLKQDIYYTQFDGNSWSTEQPMSIVNTADYSELDPVISGDGLLLYFASFNRPEFSPGYSIWATRKVNNVWQEPVPLDTTINIPAYEERYCPAISFDGSKFYFGVYDHDHELPSGMLVSDRIP